MSGKRQKTIRNTTGISVAAKRAQQAFERQLVEATMNRVAVAIRRTRTKRRLISVAKWGAVLIAVVAGLIWIAI
jgi:hypothetical protein